jgi:hypothetical protein
MFFSGITLPQELCNGTRLQVKRIRKNIAEVTIKYKIKYTKGEIVFIPRIVFVPRMLLIPADYPFEFKQHSFPLNYVSL